MAEVENAKSPRERYRAQVRAEVKERAWEQIAAAGASALSLNAIAKKMGMSGPALYRYFASRDELITELIRDAYRSLADTFRAAAAVAEPTDVTEPTDATEPADSTDPAQPLEPALATLAHALRGWALADPQRYFLVYGTPVPGYHAPDDVTAIASEIMAFLLDACAALPATGPESRPATGPATPFGEHLDAHREWAAGHPAPPAALHRAMAFWTRLHGVLSLELAGHFDGMGFDPALLFAAELDDLLGIAGIS
ncbi:TetR/AcrR family transcriptional regulator [Streptomyces sp. NPDC002328]|uniref:TetR/AcrR family transcriptional regulator n=1 Tax=Streptomyces sp. NPDC002328 TaxID=3364642 RepID=UPI0036ABF894